MKPTKPAGGVSGGGGALAILEQRYARGEITKGQFVQMKDEMRR